MCVGEVGGVLERDAGAGKRLQRGPLRDRRDPRRRPAVKGEVRTPRRSRRAQRGEAEGLIEQAGERGVLALVIQPVGGAESAEPLDLDSLPGVVSQTKPGCPGPRPADRRPAAGPVVHHWRLLDERQDQLRDTRGCQRTGVRDRREVGEDGAQLGLSRAAPGSCRKRGPRSAGAVGRTPSRGGARRRAGELRERLRERQARPRRRTGGRRCRGRRRAARRPGTCDGAGHRRSRAPARAGCRESGRPCRRVRDRRPP